MEHTNATDTEVTSCRNSVQGRTLIVDDEGYVCSRSNVAKSGCCIINYNNGQEFQQYSCHSCNDETGCCATYEYCVSCCLNPNKVKWHWLCIIKKNFNKIIIFHHYRDMTWK